MNNSVHAKAGDMISPNENATKEESGLIGDDQIKNRDRVRDLAEVYTAKEQVDAMLDLVADQFKEIGSTFLEPACGNGNFLAEILRRKLKLVRRRPKDDSKLEQFEYNILIALSSIYGIDIDAENVHESRERMKSIVNEHHSYRANSMRSSDKFRAAVDEILSTNIILGNTLDEKCKITIVEYSQAPNMSFIRTSYDFHNMDVQLDGTSGDDDELLFDFDAIAPTVDSATHYANIGTLEASEVAA